MAELDRVYRNATRQKYHKWFRPALTEWPSPAFP